MKTMRWFKGEQVWFTELGARIASNDLLNQLRDALTAYKNHGKKRPTKKGTK